MFHDRTLSRSYAKRNSDFVLVRHLNPYACKLLWLVREAESMGQSILNKEVLSCYFTQREWTLATKGRRATKDRQLVDKAAAPDGLEYFGIVIADTQRDINGHVKTVWLIGSVADEVLEEKLKERNEHLAEQDECEVIDDEGEAQTVQLGADQSPSENERDAFKRGVRHGEIKSQAQNAVRVREVGVQSLLLGKRLSDVEWVEAIAETNALPPSLQSDFTGLVQYKSLDKDNKRLCITSAVDRDPETFDENPNLVNLKEIWSKMK